MQTERHVRLFRNGRNQAVRIPREFELEGNEAVIRRDGGRLIIEPVVKVGLLAYFSSFLLLQHTRYLPDKGICSPK